MLRRIARSRRRTPTTADVSGLQARRSAEQELIGVADCLIAEFAGVLPAGTVIRQVSRAREQLLAAGVRAGLAVAVETMARTRLRTLTPAHGALG